MLPRVAVIIVNWNGSQHTLRCLASVELLTYPNLHIILVDNGSDPQDLKALEARSDRIALVPLDTNRGFSVGNNAGIRRALQDRTVEYVLILNNDAIVDPECASALVAAAQEAHADMVSPTVLAANDRATVDRLGLVLTEALLGFNMTRWEGREPFCPSGCAALYSRRLLESVALDGQYFDEDFFAYAEDLDLGIRAVLQGYRSVLAPAAVVYHHGGASLPPESRLPLWLRHRNTIWCLAKSVPGPVLLRHSGWIIAGQVIGILRAAVRGHGMAVLGAKLAGLRGLPLMLKKRRVLLARVSHVAALEERLDPRPFYRV